MVDALMILPIVIMLVAMLAMLAVYAWKYKKTPPDRAMVVYGRQMRPGTKIGYMVIPGGGKFLLPIIEDVKYMDLGLKEVNMELDNLRTDPTKGSSEVRINLTVLYKISSEPSVLHVACEHLLDKTGEDVKSIVETLVKGHVRGVVATLTPEEIDLNRDRVEQMLTTMAWQDLLNIGIDVKASAIIKVHRKGVT